MKDDELYDVAIIGAGASGLISASVLAEKNIKTILIEKNSKIGRKLLSTGAGKANLSNTNISTDFYLCDDKRKLQEIFKKTPSEEVLNFLRYKLGVFTVVKERGKIYPLSEKSENVSFAFENFLKNSSVSVKLLTLITSVHYNKNIFEIKAKTLPHRFEKNDFVEKEFIIRTRNLVISTGGPSYPKIGGTYSGFDIAKTLGHSINEIKPLITPFEVESPNLSLLDGIRRNARVVISIKGKQTIIEDEVLFTDYGISGPLALDLSFYYGREGEINSIFLDLYPELSDNELISFFNKRIDGSKSFKDLLFPSVEFRLAEFILKKLSIKADDKTDIKGIERFVSEIKNLRLEGLTPCGFDMAMSKTGGVPLDEIDEGFESKKIKNLFITGELLDSGGKSGGYNLHFAFTSGYASAKKIIERIYG